MMSDWEIELRAHLESSLAEGSHEIGTPGGMIQLVTKQAKINYEVSIRRQTMKINARYEKLSEQKKAEIEQWVEAFKNK
jgi:hypothetical protein